ncbi:MAG: hypothetical protein ACOY3P_15505 [Planctomycetota bacterium]
MVGQSLGDADLQASVPEDATPQQCIRALLDLIGACEKFLLAGLRREVGPEGDLRAAYRRWYAAQMETHDQMMVHLMEEFTRREGSRAS